MVLHAFTMLASARGLCLARRLYSSYTDVQYLYLYFFFCFFLFFLYLYLPEILPVRGPVDQNKVVYECRGEEDGTKCVRKDCDIDNRMTCEQLEEICKARFG